MSASEQVLRVAYNDRREEATVSYLGDPDSIQAIRADGPEAVFGSEYVQIIRCRTRLLKRTGEVEAECVAPDSEQRHRFGVRPGRFYDCTCQWHRILPMAIALVKTEDGRILHVQRFDREDAIMEGQKIWKSLWEGTYADVLVRASSERDLHDGFVGRVFVRSDVPGPI